MKAGFTPKLALQRIRSFIFNETSVGPAAAVVTTADDKICRRLI